jgi:ATP-dependent Clp protease ATP-binding subunit ClpC
MFERFTDRARAVVVLAQEEARAQRSGVIAAQHLLLGMIHEGKGVAAIVLSHGGAELEKARAVVRDLRQDEPEKEGGHLPFTPSAKKALEGALREALDLGHNYIGTEHQLLGLCQLVEQHPDEDYLGETLRRLDLTPAGLREAVGKKLKEYGAGGASEEREEPAPTVTTAAAVKELGLEEHVDQLFRQRLRLSPLDDDSVRRVISIYEHLPSSNQEEYQRETVEFLVKVIQTLLGLPPAAPPGPPDPAGSDPS